MGRLHSPGSYHDIGKKVKDLLNRDFSYDQKFTVSSTTATGVTFHHSGVKKGDELYSDVKTEFKYNHVKSEIKVDTKSKVHGSFTLEDLTPGVKVTLSGNFADQKSAKAEVVYAHEYAHIISSIGLTAQPVVEGSVTFGSQGVAFGVEGGYDTATNKPTKYNFAVGVAKKDFSAALILADKADTIKASYLHTLSHASAIGVEIAHKFAKNDITFTAGASYRIDPLTTSKIRLNNRGSIAGLIQHEFRPKSTFTFSGEVDSKALDKSAKVGFALNLKP